ncbi:Cytochrome P450 [Corchorus capsularis]|uniref:Cytochrome P450 n=1 Tax=Corchorus capsularis TaxID=210143 RepID=A0A1R3HWM3_COCAP|nr:Cytochrome P450 [Corchorus capsularis]
MEMEVALLVIRVFVSLLVSGTLLIWGWRILNWVWLEPKRLEKWLRQQGLAGNSYRFLYGDMKENFSMVRQTRSKPMPLSDDIVPYATPFLHQTLKNYGKNSFIWIGPRPRVTITEPEQVKEVFTKFNDFQKPRTNPLVSLLAAGLASLEGDKWAKHRKILNHAFLQDKLKNMLPAFYQSCIDTINKWEKMVSMEGRSELDVWPYVVNLSQDVISRAAFGGSYEEGMRIFQLLEEQIGLVGKVIQSVYIPGWRFLPTQTNRKMKAIDKDMKDSLREMIKKREKQIKGGEECPFNSITLGNSAVQSIIAGLFGGNKEGEEGQPPTYKPSQISEYGSSPLKDLLNMEKARAKHKYGKNMILDQIGKDPSRFLPKSIGRSIDG